MQPPLPTPTWRSCPAWPACTCCPTPPSSRREGLGALGAGVTAAIRKQLLYALFQTCKREPGIPLLQLMPAPSAQFMQDCNQDGDVYTQHAVPLPGARALTLPQVQAPGGWRCGQGVDWALAMASPLAVGPHRAGHASHSHTFLMSQPAHRLLWVGPLRRLPGCSVCRAAGQLLIQWRAGSMLCSCRAC